MQHSVAQHVKAQRDIALRGTEPRGLGRRETNGIGEAQRTVKRPSDAGQSGEPKNGQNATRRSSMEWHGMAWLNSAILGIASASAEFTI